MGVDDGAKDIRALQSVQLSRLIHRLLEEHDLEKNMQVFVTGDFNRMFEWVREPKLDEDPRNCISFLKRLNPGDSTWNRQYNKWEDLPATVTNQDGILDGIFVPKT